MLYDNIKKGQCRNSEDVNLIFFGFLQGPVTDICENGNEHMDLIRRGVFLEKMGCYQLVMDPATCAYFQQFRKKDAVEWSRQKARQKASRCEQTSA